MFTSRDPGHRVVADGSHYLVLKDRVRFEYRPRKVNGGGQICKQI